MTAPRTDAASPTGGLRPPGLWWILAFAATAGLAWVTSWEPIVLLRERWTILTICGGWVALAALVAAPLQAVLLRRSLPRTRAWIPCSIVGALVGYACLFLGTPLAGALAGCPLTHAGWGGCSPAQDALRTVFVFASTGVGLGAIQALLLRRWLNHAWLCIPFSAAALGAAGGVLPHPLVGYRLLPQVLMTWSAGAAGGLIKGAGLAFLLRVHRHSRPGWTD